MRKQLVGLAVLPALVLFSSAGCGKVAANSMPQADPAQQASAGHAAQVFTLATSDEAIYSDPSGGFQPMPGTSLNLQMQAPGLVTISFSARGTVQPSGSQIVPIVFIECQIDGQACQPDSNSVEFLFPQFCCDTRSFHWVAENVSPGSHVVAILWGMGNPTSAVVSNRSLIVETTTP
jgi:hypothetical protein